MLEVHFFLVPCYLTGYLWAVTVLALRMPPFCLVFTFRCFVWYLPMKTCQASPQVSEERGKQWKVPSVDRYTYRGYLWHNGKRRRCCHTKSDILCPWHLIWSCLRWQWGGRNAFLNPRQMIGWSVDSYKSCEDHDQSIILQSERDEWEPWALFTDTNMYSRKEKETMSHYVI